MNKNSPKNLNQLQLNEIKMYNNAYNVEGGIQLLKLRRKWVI